jgi:hypothetical protein
VRIVDRLRGASETVGQRRAAPPDRPPIFPELSKHHETFIHAFKLLLAFSLLAVAAGCASSSKGTQDLAIAAGFKVITPVNPEQKALLQTLPEGKITQITHDGKLYYVLPDAPNNQAYVGGPNEYQVYQQMRVAKQISDNNLAAAQMNQMNAMNWGMWGGWGGVGGFRY